MQICCIEPLRTSQAMMTNVCSHAAVGGLLFAMASLSKILVVAVRPTLQVHYKRPLSGSANTLPLLAWQFVNIRISHTDRTTDPVLLFARDQYACFLQVSCCGHSLRLSNLLSVIMPFGLCFCYLTQTTIQCKAKLPL